MNMWSWNFLAINLLLVSLSSAEGQRPLYGFYNVRAGPANDGTERLPECPQAIYMLDRLKCYSYWRYFYIRGEEPNLEDSLLPSINQRKFQEKNDLRRFGQNSPFRPGLDTIYNSYSLNKANPSISVNQNAPSSSNNAQFKPASLGVQNAVRYHG